MDLREGIQTDIDELKNFINKSAQSLRDDEPGTAPSSSKVREPRSQRSVAVFKPFDNIRSMPMALAILQEAEARYGRSVEFKFPKVSP